MRDVEYWRWWVVDEVTGKRRQTRHRMTAAEAAVQHPGSTRVDGTLEVRRVPEPGEPAPLPTTSLPGSGKIS